MNEREPVGTFKWSCALDNHEPTRNYGHGSAEVFAADDVRERTVVLDTTGTSLGTDANYLLDDGTTVEAWYVAGWSKDEPKVFLQPFPVNVHADGSPRIRPDNGREVSFDSWMLGPRKTFHLKIKR